MHPRPTAQMDGKKWLAGNVATGPGQPLRRLVPAQRELDLCRHLSLRYGYDALSTLYQVDLALEYGVLFYR